MPKKHKPRQEPDPTAEKKVSAKNKASPDEDAEEANAHFAAMVGPTTHRTPVPKKPSPGTSKVDEPVGSSVGGRGTAEKKEEHGELDREEDREADVPEPSKKKKRAEKEKHVQSDDEEKVHHQPAESELGGGNTEDEYEIVEPSSSKNKKSKKRAEKEVKNDDEEEAQHPESELSGQSGGNTENEINEPGPAKKKKKQAEKQVKTDDQGEQQPTVDEVELAEGNTEREIVKPGPSKKKKKQAEKEMENDDEGEHPSSVEESEFADEESVENESEEGQEESEKNSSETAPQEDTESHCSHSEDEEEDEDHVTGTPVEPRRKDKIGTTTVMEDGGKAGPCDTAEEQLEAMDEDERSAEGDTEKDSDESHEDTIAGEDFGEGGREVEAASHKDSKKTDKASGDHVAEAVKIKAEKDTGKSAPCEGSEVEDAQPQPLRHSEPKKERSDGDHESVRPSEGVEALKQGEGKQPEGSGGNRKTAGAVQAVSPEALSSGPATPSQNRQSVRAGSDLAHGSSGLFDSAKKPSAGGLSGAGLGENRSETTGKDVVKVEPPRMSPVSQHLPSNGIGSDVQNDPVPRVVFDKAMWNYKKLLQNMESVLFAESGYRWRIKQWSKIKEDRKNPRLDSDPFYTRCTLTGHQYKMSLHLYPFGHGSGSGNHVSLGWSVLHSERNDDFLPWPIPFHFRVVVASPSHAKNIGDLHYQWPVHSKHPAFQRPGEGSGPPPFVCEKFARKKLFEGYVSCHDEVHILFGMMV